MNTIERSLGRVEAAVESIDKKLDAIDSKIDKQDARIATVEKRQYYFMGGGAVIGSIAGFLASHLQPFIAHFTK